MNRPLDTHNLLIISFISIKHKNISTFMAIGMDSEPGKKGLVIASLLKAQVKPESNHLFVRTNGVTEKIQ